MDDTECFELCKEVYVEHPEHKDWEGKWIIVTENKELKVFIDSQYEQYGEFNFYAPLYTSDYLLEKLPPTADNKRLHLIKQREDRLIREALKNQYEIDLKNLENADSVYWLSPGYVKGRKESLELSIKSLERNEE